MDQPAIIEVTRQALYDQIWSVPVSRACRTYGLSDVGLANICEHWDIPRPPRGHWAKLRSGQTVRRRKLTPIEEGNPVIFSYQPQPVTEPQPKEPPKESDRRRDFEKRPENHISVS